MRSKNSPKCPIWPLPQTSLCLPQASGRLQGPSLAPRPSQRVSHGGHLPAVGSARANTPRFPFLAPYELDHLTNESRGVGLMRRTRSKHHHSEPSTSQELQSSLDKGKKEPAHAALGWLSLKPLTWLGRFSPSSHPGGDGAASAHCGHGPKSRGWRMEGVPGQGAWRVSGTDVSPSCCVG